MIIIVCCFFAAQSFGQDVVKEDADAPVMTFEKTEHDFGKVPINSVAEWEFKFTNTGKKPIIVQNCSSGCGCTVSNCPKSDDQVMPGESRTIKMKYTRTGYENKFSQQVTVHSSAQNSPVILSIKGEVTKDAETAKN